MGRALPSTSLRPGSARQEPTVAARKVGAPGHPPVLASLAMFKSKLFKSRLFKSTLLKSTVFGIAIAILSLQLTASAAELPSKKYLNLATVKAMIAASRG